MGFQFRSKQEIHISACGKEELDDGNTTWELKEREAPEQKKANCTYERQWFLNSIKVTTNTRLQIIIENWIIDKNSHWVFFAQLG